MSDQQTNSRDDDRLIRPAAAPSRSPIAEWLSNNAVALLVGLLGAISWWTHGVVKAGEYETRLQLLAVRVDENKRATEAVFSERERRITTLEGSMVTFNATIGSINSRLTAIETKLDGLKEQIAKKP